MPVFGLVEENKLIEMHRARKIIIMSVCLGAVGYISSAVFIHVFSSLSRMYILVPVEIGHTCF